MKTRKWILTIAATLLGVVAQCQPSPPPAYSLDFRALSAETVVIGKIVSATGSDDYRGTKTIEIVVERTLKGTVQGQQSFTVSQRQITDLRAMVAQGHRVLVFGPNSKQGLIDLDSPKLAESTLDFRVFHRSREITKYVESVLHKYAGMSFKETSLNVPPGSTGKDWQKAFPYYYRLEVPVHPDLNQWLEQKLRSKKNPERLYAINYMEPFKSPENVQLLKGLLSADEWELTSPAEYHCGTDSYMSNLRGISQETLQQWAVPNLPPNSNYYKDVPRYKTVATIHEPGRFSVSDLKNLESCPRLTRVDCDRTSPNVFRLGQEPVPDAQIREVGKFKHLTYLELAGSPELTDDSLKSLSGLKNLRELDIDQTPITDASVPTLAAFSNLQRLHIDRTEMTQAGVKRLMALRPDLQLAIFPVKSIVTIYAEDGDLGGVKRVIDRDPSVVDTRDPGGDTSLIIACRRGYRDMARYLVDHRADVNAINHKNESALEFASEIPDLELATRLVELGANVNQVDKEGDTPLHFAGISCREGIIKFLLGKGANPLAKDHNGWLPSDETRSRGAADVTAILEAAEKKG